MSIKTSFSGGAAAPAVQEPDRGRWTSASNAQADTNCPGRHLFSRDEPDDPSKDSEFGDAVHAALAKQDPSGLTTEQESIYEAHMEIESKLLIQFFGPEISAYRPNPTREKRWWVHWPDELRHSGQLDCVHRRATKALIIEYKSLPGQQPGSPANMQLRDQCVLYASNTVLITEIAVAVNQPLVTHSPEITVYGKEDLIIAATQLYERVKASNNPESPRVAGEIQCKFCKAKHKCPEYQVWAGGLLPDTKSIVDVPVAQWTPAQRRLFADSYESAAKWLENCWTYLERGAAKEEGFVPGYAMKDGSPRSKITNLQSVFDRFSKSGGSLEKFMAKATITKTDLTEVTKSVCALKGKALDSKVLEIIGNDFELSKVKQSLVKSKP